MKEIDFKSKIYEIGEKYGFDVYLRTERAIDDNLLALSNSKMIMMSNFYIKDGVNRKAIGFGDSEQEAALDLYKSLNNKKLIYEPNKPSKRIIIDKFICDNLKGLK